MHLYAAYLGGTLGDGRMGEDHETVFVVAPDDKAAARAAKRKWKGAGRAHVDAIQRLDRVDGFVVTLAEGDPGDAGELDPTYRR